jgi:hypothetical protein
MAGNAMPASRRAIRTPPEGQGARQPITGPQIAYCQACGHDPDRHRHGRCWTDWLGLPVTRARTQITCTCEEYTP